MTSSISTRFFLRSATLSVLVLPLLFLWSACSMTGKTRSASDAPVPAELQAAAEVYDGFGGLDAQAPLTREEALKNAAAAGLDSAGTLASLHPFEAALSEKLADALPSLRDSLLHARLHDLLDDRLADWSAAERAALWSALLELRFAPRRDTPPVEDGTFREPDLVELIDLDSTFLLDIRYAGTNNFAERQVYDTARAFLQRPAAEALARVQAALREQGLGIVVYDGYRPWSVTKIFWEVTPDAQRQFVADPNRGSRHNRGCAADVGLYDLSTRLPLEMPSDYDDFSERAYPTYGGGSAEARASRDLLIQVMRVEGFETYPTEWWHFDFRDWRSHRVLDQSFDELDP